VKAVGLDGDLVHSSPVVGTVRGGRVIENDTTRPLAMAFTPLLSWSAKLRFARGLRRVWSVASRLDAYGMADHAEHDHATGTAEAKALELFGREVTDYLIDPLVRMIGGAGPSRISQLLMLGGLNSWSAPLMNLRGGLDRLPTAVAERLRVTYRANVTGVEAGASGVDVRYVDAQGAEQHLRADQCVLACRFEDAVRVSPWLAQQSGTYGEHLQPARLIDIKVAYAAPSRSRAFACQVPTIEDPELLMYTLTHNKAPDRAPAGHSLFTLYTDDGRFESLAPRTDDALIEWARTRIEALYPEVKGHFRFGHVGRYARAGYRADPGYFIRTAALMRRLPADAPIQLGGDVYGAGSMEAAVLWGERAAENLLSLAGAARRAA
jgi:protoporphyrinogen oxidase